MQNNSDNNNNENYSHNDVDGEVLWSMSVHSTSLLFMYIGQYT